MFTCFKAKNSTWYTEFENIIERINSKIDENSAEGICYWFNESRTKQLEFNVSCYEKKCSCCGDVLYVYIPRDGIQKPDDAQCITCRMKNNIQTTSYITFDRVNMAYDIMTKYSTTKHETDKFLDKCKEMTIAYASGRRVMYKVLETDYDNIKDLIVEFNQYDSEGELYQADPFHRLDYYIMDEKTGELIEKCIYINLDNVEAVE